MRLDVMDILDSAGLSASVNDIKRKWELFEKHQIECLCRLNRNVESTKCAIKRFYHEIEWEGRIMATGLEGSAVKFWRLFTFLLAIPLLSQQWPIWNLKYDNQPSCTQQFLKAVTTQISRHRSTSIQIGSGYQMWKVIIRERSIYHRRDIP